MNRYTRAAICFGAGMSIAGCAVGGSVRVEGQDRRPIYVDGLYDAPIGTAPGPFLIDFGAHTLETLDSQNLIDNRKTVSITKSVRLLTVTLDPLQPHQRH